jgi:signal transduction histidine kinase
VTYLEHVQRFASLARRHGLDALIIIGAILGAVDVASSTDPTRGPTTSLWFAVPAAAMCVLPLLFRHRFPFAAPAAVWIIGPACTFIDDQLVVNTFTVYVAGMAAAFLLGNCADAVAARIGLVMTVVGSAIVVYNNPNRNTGDFVFIPAVFVIAWLAGFAMRARVVQADAAEQRAIHAERERESAARVAVAEERARITRELHDIVAHSLSVMVLQVGAVRHKLPSAMTEDREALVAVEQTGRSALAEMRRLLGALHDDGPDVELAPQPGLDDLDALAERVGRAGLPVQVHVEGQRYAVPRAIDLSAYRIIQEGLTNSLKHAHAKQADVTVSYGADRLAIEVRDDGVGASGSDGLGRGLVGVRERVKIYGGEMTAGASPDGGFVLSARLPVDGDSR